MQRSSNCAMLALALWAIGLPAQDRKPGANRLVDTVEAPYAYLWLEGAAPAPEGGGGRATVQRLLADPSLDAVLGGGGERTGSSTALSFVRGLLRRGALEFELAMTGVLPRGGQPLLVLRVRLQGDEARRLELVLAGDANAAGGLASPHRRIGDRQTYRLAGRGEGPGEQVELALLGDDLVVGNDSSAMHEVLEPAASRGTTAAPRTVLSQDPRFQALRQRLEVPRGALLLYGDWERLGRRLAAGIDGAPAHLLGGSGLGGARSLMMTLAPASGGAASGGSSTESAERQDFTATLLLDLDESTAAGLGGSGRRHRHGSPGIDGWFAATQPVSARQLLRELPSGGLGGLVLSVDLASVARFSPSGAHVLWDLRRAFTDFGLDFDRQVLARLGSRGTVQLHFGDAAAEGGDAAAEGGGAAAEGGDAAAESGVPAAEGGSNHAMASVSAVYAVRAKSRKAATDLFGDVRRVVEPTGRGRVVEVADEKARRPIEVLELLGRGERVAAYVAVHEDALMLAASRDALTLVLADLRESRPRGRRDQVVGAAIQAIGGETVAGLFDLDLSPVFAAVAAALPGVDVSSLPARHVGYLDTDAREGGTVVRVRVLSSR